MAPLAIIIIHQVVRDDDDDIAALSSYRGIPPEHPLAVCTPNTKRMDITAPSSAGLDTIIGCGQSKFTLPFCISSARNAGTDSQTFNMSIAADFEKVLNLPCLALYKPNPHTRGSAPSS